MGRKLRNAHGAIPLQISTGEPRQVGIGGTLKSAWNVTNAASARDLDSRPERIRQTADDWLQRLQMVPTTASTRQVAAAVPARCWAS